MPQRLVRFLIPLALLALMSAILLMPPSEQVYGVSVAQDSGHGVVFCLAAILGFLMLRARSRAASWSPRRQYLLVFGAAVFLGLFTELVQIPLERDATLGDWLNDALGSWLGLAVIAAFDRRLQLSHRVRIAASGVIPLAILALPLGQCVGAYIRRNEAFPVIADFRSDFDTYFVRPHASDLTHELVPERWSRTTGERAMHITFRDGELPGANFFEPYPDWIPYQTLIVDVTNLSVAPLTLRLRVHDFAHDSTFDDRFNASVELAALERRELRFPLAAIEQGPRDRTLDLAAVSDMTIYVSEDTAASATAGLLVSRLWLE